MNIESDFETLIKLAIIGDSNVGKSNFLFKFIEGQFSPLHVATIGFDYKSRVVTLPKSKKRVKLQIWDTAGQEKYMSINKNLFQRVQGIMLMYDISNEESFNHLNKWIEHIKENSSGSPVILIGNKSDLEKERKVSKENGETFAKSHNLLFFEASAKNGTNVNESFLKLGEIIIKDEKFIENRDKNKTEYVISKNTSKKTKKKCC